MILLKNIEIETIDDLKNALQHAVELEHATIPPYLTANFTLYNTGNDDISELLGSVLGEEMLHLSIAANLLNAIGGHPVINKPPFIPTYPGPLPGGVQSSLHVPLAKFSLDLVQNVFMEIERPLNPIHINLLAVPDDHMTIGQFYDKIQAKIEELGEDIFIGDPNHQMTFESFFPKNLLFPITGVATAVRGINIIKDQGEGSTTDPLVNPDDEPAGTVEPAHYYRFQQIVKGKMLVKNPDGTYSYSGAPVAFNAQSIPNMRENPKMRDYPVNSLAYVNSKLFNYSYTGLLNSLHRTFNGEPDQIKTAMGLMFSIRLYALKLLALPDPNHPGFVAGPSFEYVTNEDLTPTERGLLTHD